LVEVLFFAVQEFNVLVYPEPDGIDCSPVVLWFVFGSLMFILYSLNGEYFFLFYICINLFLLRGATFVVVVVVVVGSFQLLN